MMMLIASAGSPPPRTRAILDLNHDFMLKQMTGTKLEMKNLLASTSKDAAPPLPPAPPQEAATTEAG
jgi:hypothetical protein